ncbi:glycosyltransferase family 2 protein [Parabacteroides sp. OttesenSCG-928-G06]|nr:glycosyltransferase family 2 protein [Parabacteroides sp. OttesenSCG-928-K15]MDL2282506.1 glycosyltransferase family 2 protein [Parabacteroides sp. OttesenSCG-928-G06]
MGRINCFLVYKDREATQKTVRNLRKSPLVGNIYLLANDTQMKDIEYATTLHIKDIKSTTTLRTISNYATTDFTLLYTQPHPLETGMFALERFVAVAMDTAAGMLYADYSAIEKGVRINYPVIDYQTGSLRDDFNFGSLLFFRSDALKKAVESMHFNYQYAGLYELRLKVSQQHRILRIPEYLYTVKELTPQATTENQFAYVDPRNREVQIEMETVCTEHLKQIGGYLPASFRSVNFDQEIFLTEASVIIPVRNRVRTLEDAIRSVLGQQTRFRFNLIIIDNHSTDGTTELIERYAADERLIHIRPERNDLGIGGCWNLGVHHAACGRFAVQLDSDDVYSDENTLQKIVDAFYEQQCAMVIGTYRMTDFNMQTIPPGIIDHREWTPENGRNNALRINGLGAPRAFFTPVLRSLTLPNTSYGEDYAIGLRISREYQIGRIYEVLYLCRRWEDNSDASLDIEKANRYNSYKDWLRSCELEIRQHIMS